MNCENLPGSVITVLAFCGLKSPFLFSKVMLKSRLIMSCTGVPKYSSGANNHKQGPYTKFTVLISNFLL